MKRIATVSLAGILAFAAGPTTAALSAPVSQEIREALPQAESVGVDPGLAGPGVEEQNPPRESPYDKPAFWGTRLINLPTTTPMGAKDVLLRISHRFYGPVDEGYETFFGLDSGANVFFSLGYGITDKLGISIGRARLFNEWELGLDWAAVEQGVTAGLPFSAALHAGFDWVTQEGLGTLKWNLQLSLSRQVNRRLSVLAVPSLSTNTNFQALDPEGTFALGLGCRYMIFEDFSIALEWIPVLAGFKDVQNGWGLGLEKKIGGHVFQVFVTNAFGLTGSQIVPGGDLRLGDLDFRIGFNFFRTF